MTDKMAKGSRYSRMDRTGRDDPDKMGCLRCLSYQPYTRHLCFMGCCAEFYCNGCNRYSWGAGPAECPCDYGTGKAAGSYGHGTKAEQPTKPAPHRADYRRRCRARR